MQGDISERDETGSFVVRDEKEGEIEGLEADAQVNRAPVTLESYALGEKNGEGDAEVATGVDVAVAVVSLLLLPVVPALYATRAWSTAAARGSLGVR